jgi:AraC-like DNA-binding protein
MGRRSAARHEGGAIERELVFGRPHPRLRAHVKGYCGYVETLSGLTCRVELPSASVGLIAGFGSPVEVSYPGADAAPTSRVTSFVAGLHDSHAVVMPTGFQQGVQVQLAPLAARMLLGVPMHRLANRVVDFEDILGKAGARLTEQLCEARSWDERFHLVDGFLLSALTAAPEPPATVAQAWRTLRATRGRHTIRALADHFGMSRQRLVTTFDEEVGLAPKTVARILHFEHALQLLHRGDLRPALVAYECGYYDQAHLNREFRQLAGSARGDYLARRLPDGGVAFR